MNTEPTINLLSILLLLGGFNGILFAIILVKLRKRNFAANRFLAGILVANSLLLLNQFLVESHLIYQLPFLLGSTIVAEVIFPPCLYLYVRTMTQPYAPNQKTLIHFIPSLVCTLLIIPFYLLDFDTKKAIFDSNYIQWPGVLEHTIPIYLTILAFQFSIYLALSFKLLFKHTKNIAHFFSYKKNITLAWLRNFLLFNILILFFFISFYIAFSQSNTNIKNTLDWFLIINVLYIFYLGIMGLMQRRIYKSHFVHSRSELPVEQTIDVITKTSNKYKKSALTSEMSTRILKRLNETMEIDKPYLESSLTLPQLAKMVPTSSNYLSQVINEQLQMKFFDYINSFRIKVAKDLLINPLPHTSTILDIAMESAFNSKSAFYSAFKKQVGITPVEFKKHIESSDM